MLRHQDRLDFMVGRTEINFDFSAGIDIVLCWGRKILGFVVDQKLIGFCVKASKLT